MPRKGKQAEKVVLAQLIKKGTRAPMPGKVSPMLCTLTKEVTDDPRYLYEIKWDGYRVISYTHKGKAVLHSRSALDYTAKYPGVARALELLGHNMVLDGEVVVFNESGMPDFDALQLYNGHDSPISYCVFDILWLDGYSMVKLPLSERKALLQLLVEGNPVLRFSETYDDGPGLYAQMMQLNLEGIIAKKRNSLYTGR